MPSSPSVTTRGHSQQALQQAATQAGSPGAGAVSELGARLAGLELGAAAPVVWSVALKPPQSRRLLVVGSSGGAGCWHEELDGDAWLASKLLFQGWTGFICYNDEPPPGSSIHGGVTFGHCKGILAWSPTRLGWLVHSMPAWPALFSDTMLSEFVASGVRCGQSFTWLSLERTPQLTRSICDQVRLMNACVYAARVTPDEEQNVGFAEDKLGQRLPKPYRLVPPSLIALGPGVWHMAKDKEWGHGRSVDGRPTDFDFYEDGLAVRSPFEGFWHVQSWLNGDVHPFGHTEHCDNVLQILLPDGAPYETTKDHAKWGVHAERPLVVMGDLNRTQTQARRGGGGLVIRHEGLWRALASVIAGVGAEHPPPPEQLRSVDEFHVDGGLSADADDSPAVNSAVPAVHAVHAAAAQRSGPTPGRAASVPGGRMAHPVSRSVFSPAAGGASGRRGMHSSAAGNDHVAPSSSSSSSIGGRSGSGGKEDTSSSAKSCSCKSAGCAHGRCGCRRAGRACTERCGCGGSCGLAEAPSLTATAAAAASAAAAGEAGEASCFPPTALLPAPASLSASRTRPQEARGPMEDAPAARAGAAAAAPGLPFAGVQAALGAARLSVAQGLSSVLPFAARQFVGELAVRTPVVAAKATPPPPDVAERQKAAAEQPHSGAAEVQQCSSAAAGYVPQLGEEAQEGCHCKKGCKDKRPPAQACDAPRLPPAPVTPVAPKHSGRLLFNPSSPPSRDGDDLAFLLLEPSYDAGMRRWRPTTQPTRLLPPGWLYASSGRCPVDVPAGRHGPAVQLRARRADPLGVMYDSRKFRGQPCTFGNLGVDEASCDYTSANRLLRWSSQGQYAAVQLECIADPRLRLLAVVADLRSVDDVEGTWLVQTFHELLSKVAKANAMPVVAACCCTGGLTGTEARSIGGPAGDPAPAWLGGVALPQEELDWQRQPVGQAAAATGSTPSVRAGGVALERSPFPHSFFLYCTPRSTKLDSWSTLRMSHIVRPDCTEVELAADYVLRHRGGMHALSSTTGPPRWLQ
ncbi:hypothetical protein D9Q98_004460 [Chlorella vulgaris]|uniref:Uncharacterized protein n=1 Tax=Chlorella vulgaris TaxID=3077 RepID=A0A9D4TPW4_CHLVU|nr:hypothetical protein D9Q98_004460 [Chlorella vulgaris]